MVRVRERERGGRGGEGSERADVPGGKAIDGFMQ